MFVGNYNTVLTPTVFYIFLYFVVCDDKYFVIEKNTYHAIFLDKLCTFTYHALCTY